jgi:hypothetical protein
MISQIVAQTKRQQQPEILPGAFLSSRNAPLAFGAPQAIFDGGNDQNTGSCV